MSNVENIIEQYKAKGGTEYSIVYEILTSSSAERKNWLTSIISQYNDLSKLSFITLLDIKNDKNINIEILDKYVRACLEDRDDMWTIFDEYLESKFKTPISKPQNIKTSKNKNKTELNGITCKMYPGSTDVETTDLVNGLYSAAKQWYGVEYDQRLRDTIDGTLFYECGENESCIDIEERFSGIKRSQEEKQKLAGIVGMTIKLDKGNGDYQPIVVYKKTPYFDYAATLAHELFYHQFCRQSNFEVENEEGKKFYRDGIALLSQEKGLIENEALNEGLADYNTTGIMRIYTGNNEYKLDPRRLYAPLQEYAEQIASCYDKKELIDMITTGTPKIEELIKAKEFDFNTFSGYLDRYLRTQDFRNIEIADMYFESFRAEHDMTNAIADCLMDGFRYTEAFARRNGIELGKLELSKDESGPIKEGRPAFKSSNREAINWGEPAQQILRDGDKKKLSEETKDVVRGKNNGKDGNVILPEDLKNRAKQFMMGCQEMLKRLQAKIDSGEIVYGHKTKVLTSLYRTLSELRDKETAVKNLSQEYQKQLPEVDRDER